MRTSAGAAALLMCCVPLAAHAPPPALPDCCRLAPPSCRGCSGSAIGPAKAAKLYNALFKRRLSAPGGGLGDD